MVGWGADGAAGRTAGPPDVAAAGWGGDGIIIDTSFGLGSCGMEEGGRLVRRGVVIS